MILVPDLASRLHAGGPGDDARVAGPAVELVALPHLERRVERHRPAVGVVVIGLRPAKIVEHGEVGRDVVRDAVEEQHLVDRAVRPPLAAGSVVRDDEDEGVLSLARFLQIIKEAPDLMVRVGEETRVDLCHPREQPLLINGEGIPGSRDIHYAGTAAPRDPCASRRYRAG